jgi:hypothetical protein
MKYNGNANRIVHASRCRNICIFFPVKNFFIFLIISKVCHGVKSITKSSHFAGKFSVMKIPFISFISESVNRVKVRCFSCRIPSKEYSDKKANHNSKNNRLGRYKNWAVHHNSCYFSQEISKNYS